MAPWVTGHTLSTGLPANMIAADVIRMEGGVLAEHWDVIQDEATGAESRSGLPTATPHPLAAFIFSRNQSAIDRRSRGTMAWAGLGFTVPAVHGDGVQKQVAEVAKAL
jgi:hypothetical protein